MNLTFTRDVIPIVNESALKNYRTRARRLLVGSARCSRHLSDAQQLRLINIMQMRSIRQTEPDKEECDQNEKQSDVEEKTSMNEAHLCVLTFIRSHHQVRHGSSEVIFTT